MRGEHTRGGGWIARAGRLLEGREDEGAEEGFLRVPVGLRALGAGRTEAADDPFRDRPAAFLRALRTILEGFGAEGG